ncbi:hypothetical protein BS47DRAFT_1471976 [Hydnum rufescens UP504]|uniref:Enoyl reductase (ER) domain-containing protein n=1 Tax=Hydnum rufescens UP504 TaxID=1448309 RepID=A0A9P6AS71_9AGAM|nr:hypothetical protein BS47DRAFT_1471976 [Hydnum rufescens UP504]
MASSKTQRAIVVVEKGKTNLVSDKAIPPVIPRGVLVKIKATTLNPTDWKHIDYMLKPGDSIGCDFAGDIVELGSEAQDKGFKVGDPVSGFCPWRAPTLRYRDFPSPIRALEYLVTYPELLWHKPANISYEDASSLNIPGDTAVLALFHRLGVPKFWEAAPPSPASPSSILIWAGSTSVGLHAIALAKLAGLKIVSSASPHNHALLKSLGADAVFDYKTLRSFRRSKSGRSHTAALPLPWIVLPSARVVDSFGENGGKVVHVLAVQPEEGWPSNVKLVPFLVYTALAVDSKDFLDLYEWHKVIPSLIEKGQIKNVIPTKVTKGSSIFLKASIFCDKEKCPRRNSRTRCIE